MDTLSVCMERRLLNYWIYITLQQYIATNDLKTLYKQTQKHTNSNTSPFAHTHTQSERESERETQIRTQACELANGKQKRRFGNEANDMYLLGDICGSYFLLFNKVTWKLQTSLLFMWTGCVAVFKQSRCVECCERVQNTKRKIFDEPNNESNLFYAIIMVFALLTRSNFRLDWRAFSHATAPHTMAKCSLKIFVIKLERCVCAFFRVGVSGRAGGRENRRA